MKNKKLLAIILLSLSFCFVSGAGYGEIQEWMAETKMSVMEGWFLEARIDYVMTAPTNFLKVEFYYDPDGTFPMDMSSVLIDTKGKIIILIYDTRNRFSSKSGISLLDSFKRNLEGIYTFIESMATEMNTDIIGKLYSSEVIPRAYFSEGEYHLWEE